MTHFEHGASGERALRRPKMTLGSEEPSNMILVLDTELTSSDRTLISNVIYSEDRMRLQLYASSIMDRFKFLDSLNIYIFKPVKSSSVLKRFLVDSKELSFACSVCSAYLFEHTEMRFMYCLNT